MKKSFSTHTIVGYFLFIIVLFLCAQLWAQGLPSSKYGGSIVFATTSDPKSFNDIIAKETSTTEITSQIFEGLTTTNPFNLKVEPNLAKSWEVSEDGLSWDFTLREDVLWNDGEPFTAKDVVFTFNSLIYNPEIPNSARDIYTIDGEPFIVTLISKYQVQFTLPVKFAPFLRSMGQSILPQHKLQKAVDQGKFNFTWGIDTPLEGIVGTGPFMLSKYDSGQRIIFKKNPYYWKKSKEGDSLPYLDKIIYLIVQNVDVSLLKFMEGTLDYYGLRGMDYALLKPIEKQKNFTIYDLGPAMGSNFIIFNQNPGKNSKNDKPFVQDYKLKWFTNPLFHKAIAHAIDKEKMIEIVKNGLGYPQYSPVGPGAGFFHNPDVVKYEYDLQKAKTILVEAGFLDRNGDGILEDSDGNKVEFNLYTNAGATERVDIAGIIRNDLEQLGMKVNFQLLEFNTLVGKLTSNFQWEAIVLGLTGGVEPHFGQNVWNSSGGLHMWYPKQTSPQTDWEKRINEIFIEGVQELDETKRKIYYDEFQYIVSEELPIIYTVLSARISAVRNKFGNLSPTNYGGVFHNLEEIYLLENKN